MITRVSTEGRAGSNRKTETGHDEMNNDIALDFLHLDLSLNFKPIAVKSGLIRLELYTENFTYVEYRCYEGSSQNMAKLVEAVRATKDAEKVPA